MAGQKGVQARTRAFGTIKGVIKTVSEQLYDKIYGVYIHESA
jgi:hypothetical protein